MYAEARQNMIKKELIGNFPSDLIPHIEKIYNEMDDRCKENIKRINLVCAYGGESFEKHRKCFEASKEWLRNGTF